MTYKQFKTQQLTKDLISLIAALAIVVLSLTVCNAQDRQKQIPDTAITLNVTNNQLYQLNGLLTFADQKCRAKMTVDEYIEWQKAYQALLQDWFLQKQAQIKLVEKPKISAK